MKTICAFKAARTVEEVESTTLVIGTEIPYSLSMPTAEHIALHVVNAKRVYEAISCLPQGTMDQLLILLLEQKATVLMVKL